MRPISFLPALDKILDKLINGRIGYEMEQSAIWIPGKKKHDRRGGKFNQGGQNSKRSRRVTPGTLPISGKHFQ